MRLLHTSDTHIGKLTYGVSRRPDHEQVHDEIVAIARDFTPDLIVHSGDLFDAKMPAVDDLRFGIEMLDELAAIAPVAVVCGNHENPKLFALFQTLRGGNRVRFIDRARPPANGGILDYPARDGDRIRLAPLPFVMRNTFLEDFEDPATWSSAYADRIAFLQDALAAGFQRDADPRRDVRVFAAHLHVTGAVLANSERQVHVDDYATRPEKIPAVSYAAFGHIHKPQALAGRPWARYAGSPIPIDFGELGETKSVVCVEARPGKTPSMNCVSLSGGRPLRRARGTLDDLAQQAGNLRGSLAHITVETPAQRHIADDVQARLPDTIVLRIDVIDPNRTVAAIEPRGHADEATIGELFTDYLAEEGNAGVDNRRVADLFTRVMRAARDEQPVELADLDGGEA